MADDRLRLVAEVNDQFSAPLDKLNAKLRLVHSTGSQTAKELQKDFHGVHTTLGKANAALDGLLVPLRAIGTVSLGAGFGFGAVGLAVRNFSSEIRDLNITSKQTGITVDSLRALKKVGEEFGLSGHTMIGAADNFSKASRQIKKNWGEVVGEMRAMNLGDVLADLQKASSPQEMLDKALEALPKIPNQTARRKLAALLFGTDDIDRVVTALGADLKGHFERVRREIGSIGPETEKAAESFEKNMARMNTAIEGVRVSVLGTILERTFEKFDHLAEVAKDPRSAQLKELRANRDSLDSTIESLPGFLRGPLQRQRESYDAQIKALEKAIRQGSAEGAKDGVERALKTAPNGGATVQQQSFGGPYVGSGGGARILQAGLGLGGPVLNVGPYGGVGAIPPSGWSGGGSRRASASVAGIPPLDSSPQLPQPNLPSEPGQSARPLRGDSRGRKGAASTGEMMGYAMDQLRREGVPEANLRQAAAHLVGQAQMESGLDPNKVHDGGTGLGIYGARDPRGWGNYKGARRSDMVRWLEANGYARNSAEGQMREMAHRAMTGGYGRTRRILMGQGTGNVDQDSLAITNDFESPKVNNNRGGAVKRAFRIGPSEGSEAVEVPVSGQRTGDDMMRRRFGLEGAQIPPGTGGSGKGSLAIEFINPPPGMRPKASMDGLFQSVELRKTRQVASMVA